MYEIFYGKYPFGNYANEVIEIYKDVLKNNFSFPTESTKVSSVNIFIKNLLNKKVNERICNVNVLKKKTFFDGFKFDKLIDLRLKPPYKPTMKSYDRYLKEENPFEKFVKEDNTIKKNARDNKDNYIPTDFDPNWADEF